jgi:hypothetical protein
MLYVVLYSGQLLQDAAPLLVVPQAVAQELQTLFEDMQQQQPEPGGGGASVSQEQQAYRKQVTFHACCLLAPARHC